MHDSILEESTSFDTQIESAEQQPKQREANTLDDKLKRIKILNQTLKAWDALKINGYSLDQLHNFHQLPPNQRTQSHHLLN